MGWSRTPALISPLVLLLLLLLLGVTANHSHSKHGQRHTQQQEEQAQGAPQYRKHGGHNAGSGTEQAQVQGGGPRGT